MLKLSLDYIRDIIVEEMEMDPERVNIYNQKFLIPTDDSLFIVIEYKGAPQIISSRNILDTTLTEPIENQDLNLQEFINIGLFSRNLDAIRRKEEAVMALSSQYAQSIQEENSFKIFPNAHIEDLSYLEGAALLYRFDVALIVHAWYHKEKKNEYYDSFRVHLTVNDGLPNIEEDFDQPTEDPTE